MPSALQIWARRSDISLGDGGSYLLVSDPKLTLPPLLAWAREREIDLRHLEVLSANLEDVFLELTGRQLRE